MQLLIMQKQSYEYIWYFNLYLFKFDISMNRKDTLLKMQSSLIAKQSSKILKITVYRDYLRKSYATCIIFINDGN